MNLKTKDRLSRLTARLAWEAWYKRRQSRPVLPVLCYHRVLPALVDDLRQPLYAVQPEQFAAQLAFLVRNGYRSLTLEELAGILRGHRPLPPQAVLLTFDDGYADTYAIAWPLARRWGLALNLFLCTGEVGREGLWLMDRDGYRLVREGDPGCGLPSAWREHMRTFPHLWRPLNWEEVAAMAAGGVGIGFHGHRHRDLGTLPPEEAKADLEAGLCLMQEKLGLRPEFLALPYGGYASLPRGLLPEVHELGITWIFTTIMGRVRLPWRGVCLPRLQILATDDLTEFTRKLAGAYDPWGKLQHLWGWVRQGGANRLVGRGAQDEGS